MGAANQGGSLHFGTCYSHSERSEVSTRTQTEKYGFTHIPRVLVKCRFCSPHRVAFHHRLSDCQTWISIFKRTQSGYKPADLQDLKVRVGFKSSPIFLIVSCCFFVLLKDVKHGFLFSENLIPPTLCQFWRTALPRWL